MARRAIKPRRLTVPLREDVVRGKAHRVDRDKGVIFGVKVLGLESVNDRRYTPEALAKARPLYEGIGVFVNHPVKPGDPRPVDARFGRLVNVRVESDGLYADLEYLKSHPEAALITEAAERMPEQFGLSHNAQGEGAQEDGLFIVQEIVDVRSVDVVTEPATTGGMFEEKRPVTLKIRTVIERAWEKYSRKCTKRPRLAGVMTKLIEDDLSGEDMPADVTEPSGDHEQALKDGFCASCNAIIDDALGGEMDPKDALAKLKELLTAHAKLAEGDDEPEDDMEEEEEPKDEPKDDDKKETEEQKRLKQLERKDRARDLCEEMGVACDKVILEALMHLPDEKAMKRLLEREKGKGGAPGKNNNAPRSGATGSGEGKPTLEGVDTPEGVLAALMG